MILLGSHFTFRGFATHYKALLPEGASGSFHGRFAVGKRLTARGGESLPSAHRSPRVRASFDELAVMLAGLDG